MSESAPISGEEMAGLIQKAVNDRFRLDIADPPRDSSFELTAPATGQRFRVTVTEAPAAEAVNAAIAACRKGNQR
jgi:hypothetical protein